MLKFHHFVWLEAHPDRSIAWFLARLADGFHIHHLDHDHGNDTANNLVLMEGRDHFMVHGGKRPMRRGISTKPKVRKKRRGLKMPPVEPSKAKVLRDSGLSWSEVAEQLGCSETKAVISAHRALAKHATSRM